MLNFVDERWNDSFVSNEVNLHIILLGAETPGVDPTPQKRGPPPLLSRRGGRLPNCLAVMDRPFFLQLPTVSTYKHFITALLRLIVPLLTRTLRDAPAAR